MYYVLLETGCRRRATGDRRQAMSKKVRGKLHGDPGHSFRAVLQVKRSLLVARSLLCQGYEG